MSKSGSGVVRARFVVQVHEAHTLHYDFRIEVEGVFKSWAIPKSPPELPGEKRLAIMTQDHALAFGRFEGRIPDGHYGAGTIKIWDQGLALYDKRAIEQLAEGEFRFVLHGSRLNGQFRLLKPQHRRWRSTRKSNDWLLINTQSPE